MSAGLLKSPDEMVDMLHSLLLRYPAVVALIDPLRREVWNSLLSGARDECRTFLLGLYMFSVSGAVLEQAILLSEKDLAMTELRRFS